MLFMHFFQGLSIAGTMEVPTNDNDLKELLTQNEFANFKQTNRNKFLSTGNNMNHVILQIGIKSKLFKSIITIFIYLIFPNNLANFDQ